MCSLYKQEQTHVLGCKLITEANTMYLYKVFVLVLFQWNINGFTITESMNRVSGYSSSPAKNKVRNLYSLSCYIISSCIIEIMLVAFVLKKIKLFSILCRIQHFVFFLFVSRFRIHAEYFCINFYMNIFRLERPLKYKIKKLK